jgi:hypothetical protein
MRVGEHLHPPRTGEPRRSQHIDEAAKVEGSLTRVAPAIAGVLEEATDGNLVGVIQLDAYHEVSGEALGKLVQRRTCPKYVPGVDTKTECGMVDVPRKLCALGYRADKSER